MSTAKKQNPMQFAKSILLGEADRIRREGYNNGSVVIPITKGSGDYYLRTRVKTVQNSFNIYLYSIILWFFENYYVKTRYGNGIADFLIIIAEKRGSTLITAGQVILNSVDENTFEGERIESFVEHLADAIAKEWNEG
jgi:hypothetical protein